MADSNIDLIHNDFLTFAFENKENGFESYNELYCPFVPDLIKVSVFSDVDIETKTVGSVACSAFNNKVIGVFSENNEVKSHFQFTNKARTSFKGDHMFNFTRLTGAEILLTGEISVNIEYIRFKEFKP